MARPAGRWSCAMAPGEAAMAGHRPAVPVGVVLCERGRWEAAAPQVVRLKQVELAREETPRTERAPVEAAARVGFATTHVSPASTAPKQRNLRQEAGWDALT